MAVLEPKDLPDLRTHLAEYMGEGYGPAVIAAASLEQPQCDVCEEDVMWAKFDAIALRRAELYFVTLAMTSLLAQSTEGIGEAGFMPFDLPSTDGMAYLDGELPNETGGHRWGERALILWRHVDGSITDYPLGFVKLSWYLDRDVYLRENRFWRPEEDMPCDQVSRFPRFLWDGHVFIGYSDTAATVRVARFDRGAGDPGNFRKKRGELFRALCYLMRQRVVEQDIRLPDRAAQRRAKRNGREPDQIRVLSLRGNRAGRDGGSASGREYHHRWVVRGHWRRQWYRSIQAHRPVFIAPFLKGPEDAPLLGGEKVYRVTT